MAKILLVEDDKSLREIYGVRLIAEGYEIVSAGDGEEALAMAIKEHPDLIVSDVMMPKISGFDMLDILRSTTETKNVKVIMMTALSSDDQRARGEALGADRYLVKSQVGIEDVVRTVHEVLGDGPATFAPASTPSDAVAAPAPFAPPVPIPQPVAPTASAEPIAPAFSAPEPTLNTLPEPTAPFSSPRPGSTEATPAPAGPTDFGALINNELSAALPVAEPVAAPEPIAPVAPTAPAVPVATEPAPVQPIAPITAPVDPVPAPIEVTAPVTPIAAPTPLPPLPPVINAAPAIPPIGGVSAPAAAPGVPQAPTNPPVTPL